MANDNNDAVTPKRDRLVDAVRRMKVNEAERNDVVVDMKEADRARLELLAERLSDVFEAVPLDDDRFDFALSSGTQPRLWIDATAHVMMGRDRRVFRFVRDTRLGRIVLLENTDVDKIADQVTNYIAERLLERERIMAGETVSYRPQIGDAGNAAAATRTKAERISPDEMGAHGVGDLKSDHGADTVSASTSIASKKAVSAEPSWKRALAGLFWILLGLALGGGALLYAAGIVN